MHSLAYSALVSQRRTYASESPAYFLKGTQAIQQALIMGAVLISENVLAPWEKARPPLRRSMAFIHGKGFHMIDINWCSRICIVLSSSMTDAFVPDHFLSFDLGKAPWLTAAAAGRPRACLAVTDSRFTPGEKNIEPK